MNYSPLVSLTAASLLLLSSCGDDVAATDADTDTGASTTESGDTTLAPTSEPTTTPGPSTDTTTLAPTTDTTDDPTEDPTADPTDPPATGGPVNCVNDPGLCGPGTVCEPDSASCVADCSGDAGLCGPGTVCLDGMCKPDCSGDGICGPDTVCGPEQTCVLDCRANLLDICAGQALCNRGTGVCEAVAAFDCAAAPGLCWEDQTCEANGYCKAAELTDGLAYDVQHYDLRLDLHTADQTFAAELAIYLLGVDALTGEIVLDVGAETLVEGQPYLPYEVITVTDAADQPLTFVQDPAGSLTVTLAEPLAAGDGAILKLRYAGPFNPIADAADPLYYTGIMQRDGRNGDPYVQTFGWPVYARRWLPSQDNPRDTATFSADVGIDNDFMVLANGAPVRSGEVDGLKRSAFVLQQPVPTYAMHVIASEFEVVRLGLVDGVAVDAVVHAAEKPLVQELWGGTVSALGYFNDLLGAFPFSRYAMISVPSAFGGMEHATIISLADTGVVANGAGTRRAAIHELSHHWFGDNAHQGEWVAFWLNESLASFMELEGLRVLGGPGVYSDRLAVLKKALFADPGTFADDALHYMTPQAFPGQLTAASFNAPYVKGPWLYHMLRVQLGDAGLADVLRAIYEAHRFAPYTTDSVLAVLNATSGQDFTQFFDEWVYMPGWPQVQATWVYNDVTKQVELNVEQVQDILTYGTYTLTGPLALDFVFDDGDPVTPACALSVEFPTGETLVDAVTDCADPPTGFTVPSQANLLVELLP